MLYCGRGVDAMSVECEYMSGTRGSCVVYRDECCVGGVGRVC